MFRVEKTSLKDPNKASIKIYNLAKQTRGQLKTKNVPVVLEAGYASGTAVIFSGDARTIDHMREGADWVTHIQCGDGERQFQHAQFSKSYSPGTSALQVISDAVGALGVNPGNVASVLPAKLQAFTRGYVANGRASVELDKVMKAVGVAWSIQDGAFTAVPSSNVLPGAAFLLTPKTGLVGSPDHCTPTQKAFSSLVKAKSLLQGLIKIASAVRVEAEGVQGNFSVYKLVHIGDTFGGDWYTEMELTPTS